MFTDDQPLYNIGVIAENLQVHPETLRIWEKNKLVIPARRNKQRLYSTNDVKRLEFIHGLINEKGLNIAGVQMIISMYPCWNKKNCEGSHSLKYNEQNLNKPCWKSLGTYCFIIDGNEHICENCDKNKQCS